MSVCVRTCVCARVLVPACVGSHAMLIWVMHMSPRVHCVHVHANVCVHVCVYARACVHACAKLGVEGGGGGRGSRCWFCMPLLSGVRKDSVVMALQYRSCM